jgi:hypothetical protein
MTWLPPSDPRTTPHVEIAPRLGHVLGSGSDCPAVCPIYHMTFLLEDTRNSRDVGWWVCAPLKQSHCMLLPLGALTVKHGTHSSVNAGLLARAPDRISFASIAIYRDSGRMEVLVEGKESPTEISRSIMREVRQPAACNAHLLVA